MPPSRSATSSPAPRSSAEPLAFALKQFPSSRPRAAGPSGETFSRPPDAFAPIWRPELRSKERRRPTRQLGGGSGSEFGSRRSGGGENRADRGHAAQALAELGQIVVLGNQLDQAAVEPGKRPLHRGFSAITRRRSRPSRRCSSWLMQSRMASWVWRRTSRCSARRSRLDRAGAGAPAARCGRTRDGASIEAVGLGRRPFNWRRAPR